MAISDEEEYRYGYCQARNILQRPVAAWCPDDIKSPDSQTGCRVLPTYKKTFLSSPDVDEAFPYRPYVTPAVCSVSSTFFRLSRREDDMYREEGSRKDNMRRTESSQPESVSKIISSANLLGNLSDYVHNLQHKDVSSNNDTRTKMNVKECKESQLDSFETMYQLANLVVNFSSSSKLFPTRNTASSSAAQVLLSSPVENSIKQMQESITSIGKTIPKQVCQHPFKAKDIVWVCRTCQTDETCVLCHECFTLSDHEGHDVGFHYAQAGGCCDCGDPDAWSPLGFCPNHGSQSTKKKNCVEEGLESRVRGIVAACAEWLVLHLSNTIQRSYERVNPVLLGNEERIAEDFGVFDPEAASRHGEQRNATTVTSNEKEDNVINFDKMKFDPEEASKSKSRNGSIFSTIQNSFSLDEVALAPKTSSGLPSQHLGLLGSQQQGLYMLLHADEVHSIGNVSIALRDLYLSLHPGGSRDLLQYIDSMSSKIAQLHRESRDIIVWGTEEIICELGPVLFQCWKDGDLKAASHVGALMIDKANILKSHGLVVSVKTRLELCAEVRAAVVVDFLNALSKSCDPICQQVCLSLGDLSDDNDLVHGLPPINTQNYPASSLSYFKSMLLCDLKIPNLIKTAWHSLLLTLLAVPDFKAALANAYCETYQQVMEEYAKGVGILENSLLTLSVQFLNRPAYVKDLVLCRGLLQSLGKCLLQTLSVAKTTKQCGKSLVLDPMHPVISHRRYSPCISDLRCVLNVEGMSRLFSLTLACLDSWIESLSLSQNMDQIHAENESRGWMGAFNASISFGSMFERLLKWEDGDSFDINIEAHQLRTIIDLIVYVLTNGINNWQLKENMGFESTGYVGTPEHLCPASLPIATVSSNNGTSLAFEALPISFSHEWSFHLPLHRFIAAVIREVARRPGGITELSHFDEAFTKLLKVNETETAKDIYRGLIEYPTIILARAAQTRAGLWTRNGSRMFDQVLNYSETPFCKNLRDSDLLLVQFALLGFSSMRNECTEARSRFGCSQWINLLLHRFGVFEFAGFARAPDTDTPRYEKEVNEGLYPREKDNHLPWSYTPGTDTKRLLCLLEEFLLLIIVIHTEMPYPPISSKDDQSLQVRQKLRREIIHCLATGPKTHSELAEVLHTLQLRDKDELTKEGVKINPDDAIGAALQSSLREIAELKVNHSIAPDKWELSHECWSEYDPAFFHTSARLHQLAAEMRHIKPPFSNDIDPTPYVSRPFVAHASFERLRKDITSDSCIVAIIYRVLHIHFRQEYPSNNLKDARGQDAYSVDATSETLLARALHLLTLGAYAWEDLREDNDSELSSTSCWKSRGGGDEGSVFYSFTEEPTQSDWVNTVLLGTPCSIMDSDWYQGAETALELLYRIGKDGGIDKFFVQDKSIRAGALWLCEYSTQCNMKAATIIGKDSKIVEQKVEGDKQRRQKEAQERAMKMMKENMARFASTVENDSNFMSVTVKDAVKDDIQESEIKGEEPCHLIDSSHEKNSRKSTMSKLNTGLFVDYPQCIICSDSPYDKGDDSLVFCAYAQASTVCKKSGGMFPGRHNDNTSNELDGNLSFVGVHVSLCGHAMHHTCFESHKKDLVDRDGKRLSEFICPLCKRLSNFLIPFIDVGSDWCEWNHNAGKYSVDSFDKNDHCNRSLEDFLSSSKWWASRNDNSVGWDERSSFLSLEQSLSTLDTLSAVDQRLPKRCTKVLGKKDLYMAWNAVMKTDQQIVSTTCVSSEKNKPGHIWKSAMNQIVDVSYKGDLRRFEDRLQYDVGEFRHYLCEKSAFNNEHRSERRDQLDWPACISTSFHHDEKSELSREKLLSKLFQSIQAFVYTATAEFAECRRSNSGQNFLGSITNTNFGVQQLACEGFLAILLEPDSSSQCWTSNMFIGRIGRLRYFALSLMAACSAVSREIVHLMLDLPSKPLINDAPRISHCIDRAPIVFPLLIGHVLTHVVASIVAVCGNEKVKSDIEQSQRMKSKSQHEKKKFFTNTSVNDCEHLIKLGFIARILQVLLGYFQGNKHDSNRWGFDNVPCFQFKDLLSFNSWEKGCYALMQVLIQGKNESVGTQNFNLDEWRNDFSNACKAAEVAAFEYLCYAGSILQILVPGKSNDFIQILKNRKKSSSQLEDIMFYLNVENIGILISSSTMKEIIRNWFESAKPKLQRNTLAKNLDCPRICRVQDWPLRFNSESYVMKEMFPFFGSCRNKCNGTHLKGLPISYTDLYTDVTSLSPDSSRTAICFICGEIIDAGRERECTKHAHACGGGCGLLFLLQDCTAIMVYKENTVCTHSPYVDCHGETSRYYGRPLYLSLSRYEVLHKFWSTHLIRQEVFSKKKFR